MFRNVAHQCTVSRLMLLFLIMVIAAETSAHGDASKNNINIYNVLDFKLPSDKDDGAYIQRAIDASNNRTLFFPARGGMGKDGEYLVSKTLVLQENNLLTGETSFGHGYGAKLVMNGPRDQYLFRPREDYISTTAPTFRNLSLTGRYLIDIRSRYQTRTNRCLIDNCSFISNKDDTDGIAINLWDHDFSIIRECNFYAYFGLTNIKISGLIIDSTSFKHSTQIKVYDCIFHCAKIGITIERVNSVVISGCDFNGSKIAEIDIGGKLFNQHCRNRGMAYQKTASGWESGGFQDVNIRDNHFESFRTGIYAFGGVNVNHALRIESNNFIQEKNRHNGAIMMDFDGVNAVYTCNNEMIFAKGAARDVSKNQITGIRFRNCANPKFILDNFYGILDPEIGNGPYPFAHDYVDGGGNTNPLIFKGSNGGQIRLDSGPTQISGDLKFVDGTLSAILPKVSDGNRTGIENTNMSLLKKIRKHALLGAGQTTAILDYFPETSSGIVVLHVLIDGGDRFTSTWSIGKGSAVKISGDDIHSLYSLEFDSEKHLVYKNNHPSERHCFIQGCFIGINVF